MGYIYKISNNIDEKVYIGQTKTLIKYRWQHHLWKANHPEKEDTDYPLYRAMRKYGISNFSIELLEEVNIDLLDEKEKYWIQFYHSMAPNGYNCDLGGQGASKFNHQEILQYFLTTGNSNASKTANYFGCSLTTVLKILENNNLKGSGHCQPIYQLDKNTGEILNQFNSLKEASDILHISRTQLWEAVHNQAKTAGGYCWCKVQDFNNFNLALNKDKRKVSVYCQEKKLWFNSCTEAVAWLKNNTNFKNPSHSNIRRVCNDQNKIAYGFHWLTFDNK